jgi:hypothetical protein
MDTVLSYTCRIHKIYLPCKRDNVCLNAHTIRQKRRSINTHTQSRDVKGVISVKKRDAR